MTLASRINSQLAPQFTLARRGDIYQVVRRDTRQPVETLPAAHLGDLASRLNRGRYVLPCGREMRDYDLSKLTPQEFAERLAE